MRNMIDTNVWIDGIAGNLSKNAFLKVSVGAEWAGYSAITNAIIGHLAEGDGRQCHTAGFRGSLCTKMET